MIIQPVFKTHSVHKRYLFASNLNDLISENYPAQFLDSVAEEFDISDILLLFKDGGRSSYHPNMLLKVLF
jgi:transposase